MKYLCFILIFISTISFAAQVKIASAEWEGVTHADGSGVYFELLTKALPNEELVIQTDSFNRALNSFHNQKVDVMVGVFREETPNALFPNWYLDIEYPIVGFYNPSITQFQHITDLTHLTISWLRGYQFDRFLSEVKNPYLINSLENGFKLLANNRIQVLVDYQYNLPEQYQSTFSSIELAPARPIYIAFQRTDEGIRLAKNFDENMEKLRNSGELKKLFGSEYDHSEFSHFNPNKKKIVILTQDANLLKPLDNKNYFPLESRLLHGVIEQLTNYNIELKLIPNYADLDKLSSSESYCLSNVFKNPEREELFNFSSPFALYLGLKLYSLNPINSSTPINLPELMKSAKDKTLGITLGQSYGHVMDAQIANINESQKVNVPAKTSRAVQYLHDNHADFILAYPSVINLVPKNTLPKFSYSLTGIEDFAITYIMCNKNVASNEFLHDVNAVLAVQYQSEAFFNIQYSSIKSKFRKVYAEKFNDVFKPDNK